MTFEERMQTYFGFLEKRRGLEHLDVIIRELQKAYYFGIDRYYSEEERKKVIAELVKTSDSREDAEEKAIYLVFAYMLNKDNGFDMTVPVVRLDETLIVDEPMRDLPESFLAIIKPQHLQQYLKVKADNMPSRELLELFNVQISPTWFKWNPMYEFAR